MKKFLYIFVPAVIVLSLVGWRWSQKVTATKQLAATAGQRKNGPANVVLATAGPKDLIQTVEEVGTVESPFNVQLSPKLTGKITYLELREGAEVKKGQLLVQVDPTETEGQVLQAKSALAQAKYQYSQAKYLQNPNDANVKSQIDQAHATTVSKIADYKQVKENFDAQVHQAHAAVVDAQAKVDAAKSAIYNAERQVESAQATLEDATAKDNREETLYKAGFVAAQDYDDSKAAKKVAIANLNVAGGSLKSAKSAEESTVAELRSAEDNESIVKKTGETNIDAAWAQVKLAQAAEKYAVSIKSNVPAYKAQLTALQAAVDAAAGNLNQANARLSDCNLVSSIDGTITSRNADPGTVVNPGTSILTIQYLKWVFVSSAVPVDYAGKVIVGSPVKVIFDALPGLDFDGAVSELNKSADPQSRQFMIRLKLDNSAGKLRPGMYARVLIQTSKTNYPVVVPKEAIKTTNDGASTATVVDKDNIAHVVQVTPGEQDTSSVAVTKGLKAGDKVVVLAYTAVRDKQKVVEGGKPGSTKGKSKDSGKTDTGQAPAADGMISSGSDSNANSQGSGQSQGRPQ